LKEFVIVKWFCFNHNMHKILQSSNHMYIYNSLLRSSMLSSTFESQVQFWRSSQLSLLLTTNPLKVPLILQLFFERFVLTLLLILWVFSQSTYSPLVKNLLSHKYQLTTRSSTWERERERSHAFVEKILYCKRAPRRGIQKTQVVLTLKFVIILLCRKWGVSVVHPSKNNVRDTMGTRGTPEWHPGLVAPVVRRPKWS
jgi:hypothetical protein